MIGPRTQAGNKPLPHSLGQAADDGMPDPDLEAALYAWATADGDTSAAQRAVIAAFRKARVYVPAVAPESDKLGIVALRRDDGKTAIAVFTGIERLVQWRPDARPLPHTGAVVASMAADEGHLVCMVDIDGPITATLPIETLIGHPED